MHDRSWHADCRFRRSRRPPDQAENAGGALDRTGSREQVPLSELAAEPAQPLQLVGILDPLSDDPKIEVSSEGDDRGGERPLPGVAFRRTNEVLGDLEDIDREPAQVAERRVSGPEIVDGDPDAARAQRLELAD